MTRQYKPKILIVHNYYQVPGGEDTVVENEKQLLRDNGHDVYLYTRSNLELIGFSFLRKILLPFTSIFSIKTYRDIKKIIKQREIDIIHVHNTLILISPSVYYAAFSCKIPVVQTIHNFRLICPGGAFYRNGAICEDCLRKGLKNSIKHKCYRGSLVQTLVGVIILNVHRMLGTYKKLNYICLTEFNKQKLLELNSKGKRKIDESKVFVKPNFVNIKREIIPYKQRKNQFVFVGRLDKLKGIDLLLNAWKKIKDWELLICGIGPEEEWCRTYIKNNGLTNVRMLGFVSNSLAIDIIANSKALILPTKWYEGFPMTIVESYASGTPVIGSDIGNVGILIDNGVTGYKFKSIDSLINSIKCCQNFAPECFEKFSKHYSSEINYKNLINIYNKIKSDI